jgi:GT2 family glycosyltransferase
VKSNIPHISIIILNWNGWKDTIECLESVLISNYHAFHIILVDNCSTDESVSKIINWATGEEPSQFKSNFPQFVFPEQPKPIPIYRYSYHGQELPESLLKLPSRENLEDRAVILIENQHNSGFAAGNNLGMEIDNNLFDSEYIYLLNNDTVIEPRTMKILVECLEDNPEIGAVTSAIYHYTNPDKIANFGGKLFWWGIQRYYKKPTGEKIRYVTFSTGCSLMIRREVIDKYGPLSDLFFFGEEDFEFSLRLRKNRILMACVPESKIYHKESVSSQKLYNKVIKKKFIHIFNRFIDMKNYYPPPVFLIWKWVVIFFYFFWLILKHRESIITALKFANAIRYYTYKYQDAKKSTIDFIYSELKI